MNHKCDRCGIETSEILKVGNAERTAEYGTYIGIAYPQYDFLCNNCASEVIGITQPSSSGITQSLSDTNKLLSEINAQKALMILVSTGGQRIQEKEEEYRQRRVKIASKLNQIGMANPNPYTDLWAWYEKWSSGDLPSYQSRRKYISDLFNPLIIKLERRANSLPAEAPVIPTGWARVDRGVDAIRDRLETARTEEEFQIIGLLCRETLISLAQSVYDQSLHGHKIDTTPSKTDANRMLEAYFAVELEGGSNEAARNHARASLKLAVELQHRRTADFVDAAQCSEATRSVVNIVAIISGRRNPS
jgi:hypothetical protein